MLINSACRRLGAAITVCSTLAACEATIRGEPEVQFDQTKPVAAQSFEEIVINTTLARSRVAEIATRGASVEERNGVIYARMAEIDALYNDYERALTKELRESGFVGALAELAVDTAGALTGQQASQILSAVSAGITGTQTAVQKDLLVDRTVQAFISQMRASRSVVKRRIILKLNAPAAIYPLQAAVSDLSDYRQAGTLTGALTGIAVTAADEEATRREDLSVAESAVISGRFGETNDTRVLNKFINTDDGVTSVEDRLRFLQTLYADQPASRRADCPGDGLDAVLFTQEPGCKRIASSLVLALRTRTGG